MRTAGMSDEIKEKLQHIFQEIFDDSSIVLFDEMSAKDIDEWDSLTHIQLIIASEQFFDIRFMTAEIAELKTVGEFVRLICAKQALNNG
jgi:acyl carrier protein